MFLAVILSFFTFLTPALAVEATSSGQSSPNLFDKYKTDFLYQRDLYQKAYINYTNKKQVHTRYGTVTTREEKNTATKEAMIARNNLLRAYLLALRVSLDQSKAANATETEKYQIELNKLESWCDEQNTIVSSLNNDSDITKYVEGFKDKYVFIQTIIYSSLIQNEINFHELTLTQIKNLANSIGQSPQITPENQQWLNSLPVKYDLVNESLAQAKTIIEKKQTSSQKFTNNYSDAKTEINQAVGYMIGVMSNLQSIVVKFK